MTPLPILQLRCHCNPDHNKFLSLSNTAVVGYLSKSLFMATKFMLNDLGGTDPGKTLSSHLNNAELSILSRITTVFTHPPKRSVLSSSEAFYNSKSYPFTIGPSQFYFHIFPEQLRIVL